MGYTIEKVDVWVGFVPNTPGEGGKALGALNKAGAMLEFLFTRPTSKGGMVYFVAPLKGAAVLKSAKTLGIKKCAVPSLKITGPDKSGLVMKIAEALGAQSINIEGLSAMGIKKTAMIYMQISKENISKAQKIIKKLLE